TAVSGRRSGPCNSFCMTPLYVLDGECTSGRFGCSVKVIIARIPYATEQGICKAMHIDSSPQPVFGLLRSGECRLKRLVAGVSGYIFDECVTKRVAVLKQRGGFAPTVPSRRSKAG